MKYKNESAFSFRQKKTELWQTEQNKESQNETKLFGTMRTVIGKLYYVQKRFHKSLNFNLKKLNSTVALKYNYVN